MATIPQPQPLQQKSKFHLVKGSEWQILKDIQKGISGEIWDDIWVENEDIRFLRKCNGIFVNDAFVKLWNVKQGLLFLDGGYGSSKTTYAITRLLVKALEHKQFKCFYGRQKKTEARELHSNIIREIKRNNWEELFDYSEKPNGTTQICCIANGNSFELFGCDDVDSLKGIDNPTDILIDEINQLNFEAFGMLWTRLRTPGVELQLIGCFNNCDVYPDHWLVKYIYGEEDASEQSEQILVDALRKSNITRHHSTYLDNKFQNPDNYYQKLVIKAGGDPDKIQAYCEGAWGIQLNAQPYYKMFRRDREVGNISYNPMLPLHISWDDNKNPYLPLLITQLDGNNINLIDEIAASNPNNTVMWVCNEFRKRYQGHTAGLFVYGDSTSNKDDTKQEKGVTFYSIILEYLAEFFPVLRVPISNPNNNMRGNFANMIFSKNYGGLKVTINERCKHMIDDFQHCMENPEGKGKDKTRVMVNNVRGVQKYGHFGDCFDYLICEAYQHIYLMFQNGGVSYPAIGGGRLVLNSSEYNGLDPKLIASLKSGDITDSEFIEKYNDGELEYDIWKYSKARKKSRNTIT